MEEKRAWWKEAVVYQIYPRSFADSNGDGIGDLNGITAHLEHIRNLGADVIWLSPVYKSPNDDNGYDISDYQDIMDDFGTMQDFDRMLARAHELGLKIVMDLVVNHTSDEHAWFIESRASRDNPKRDWYIWKPARADGGAPTNWGSWFGGSAWEYDARTDMYYLHCFSKKQPDLNWENPKVRDAVFDMMTWWCDKGIDGFRMDVISMISKDPAYRDGPVYDGFYGELAGQVCNGPRVHEFLQEMNRRVLSKYDIMTVGEAAGVTIDQAKQYARSDQKELNMVFHFEHTDGETHSRLGKWEHGRPSLPWLRGILNKWQTELEGKAWNSLYWDNHDQPRAVSRYGDDSPKWRVKSAKMLATLLHMMKGTPYVYQGEEIGMTNCAFASISELRDIESVNAWDKYVGNGIVPPETMLTYLRNISRDNARTPMQWDDTENAGFTTGEAWIGVNPNYREINVKNALADPDSVYYYYKKLIALRHELDVIVYGTFEPLMEDSDQVYAYRRVLGGQTLTVVCNYTDQDVACPLADDDGARVLIENDPNHVPGRLSPYEARVLLREA